MVKSSIEKLAEEIGYDIGMSDDQTQSNLLNGLCASLSNSMQKQQLEMQLCYISKNLNQKTEQLLINLVEFIKLKNNEQ